MTAEISEAASRAQPTGPDSGTRRVMKMVVMTAFFVGMLAPFAADELQDVRLQVWYNQRLDKTMAPQLDRLSTYFVWTSESAAKAMKTPATEEEQPEAGPKTEPVTFMKRVVFVFTSVLDWMRKPSEQGSAVNVLYFWGLVAILGFLVLARLYGFNRAVAIVSGLLGPDRFKKLVIDLFFLKGVERTVFPSTRDTSIKNGKLAMQELNRVDLHDIVRVTVGVQGEGRIESLPDSLKVEGRGAYTYCAALGGGGGDYYFNLAHVTQRSVRIQADVILNPSTTRGHVGRIKFDIHGFKGTAWE